MEETHGPESRATPCTGILPVVDPHGLEGNATPCTGILPAVDSNGLEGRATPCAGTLPVVRVDTSTLAMVDPHSLEGRATPCRGAVPVALGGVGIASAKQSDGLEGRATPCAAILPADEIHGLESGASRGTDILPLSPGDHGPDAITAAADHPFREDERNVPDSSRIGPLERPGRDSGASADGGQNDPILGTAVSVASPPPGGPGVDERLDRETTERSQVSIRAYGCEPFALPNSTKQSQGAIFGRSEGEPERPDRE
jgi:hypothetical protein